MSHIWMSHDTFTRRPSCCTRAPTTCSTTRHCVRTKTTPFFKDCRATGTISRKSARYLKQKWRSLLRILSQIPQYNPRARERRTQTTKILESLLATQDIMHKNWSADFWEISSRYPNTIHALVSAVLKLQRKTVLPEGLTLYRGLGRALLPPEFYASAKATGIKGLTEFGFMSTTSKVQLCCSVLQCVVVCCSVLQ